MDRDTYFRSVYDRLIADGFEMNRDKIGDLFVDIAKKKEFRLKWMATKLNIFVIMSNVNSISKDLIQWFSSVSLEYTITYKTGLPRGVQSGAGCFALLVSTNVNEDAKRWVQQKPKKHFAAFEMPVICDLSNNQIYYCQKTPIWGAIYYNFFREFIWKNFSVI